jgi:hypothetical protein
MAPQERVDRLLHMQQRHREQLGETARGMERVVRIIDRSPP